MVFPTALYANLTRVPSLLPSKRSADQTKQAYRMLSDIFRLMSNRFLRAMFVLFLSWTFYYKLFWYNCRYGMSTSCCRAKTLVEYFVVDFSHVACLLYVMLPFILGFVLIVAITVFFWSSNLKEVNSIVIIFKLLSNE